jgi:hypothetical protein
MRNEIVFQGCIPVPLASSLKALAVLRQVSEAGAEDSIGPDATGAWRYWNIATNSTRDAPAKRVAAYRCESPRARDIGHGTHVVRHTLTPCLGSL